MHKKIYLIAAALLTGSVATATPLARLDSE
jgi:hypothetical protein